MKHSYKPRILSRKTLNRLFLAYSGNIEQISFYHLKVLLENKCSFNLFIGGYWCRNCLAIMPQVKKVIEEKEVKLYMLDPRPYSIKKQYTDIRKSLSRDAKSKHQYLLDHMFKKYNNENNILRVPFITHIEKGMAGVSFQEEYVFSDITPELSSSIIEQLSGILR